MTGNEFTRTILPLVKDSWLKHKTSKKWRVTIVTTKWIVEITLNSNNIPSHSIRKILEGIA